MSEVILSLEGVNKRYGAFHAVNNLSFSVNSSEIFGFLGPNGAGKTSTLRMLLDIIQPTSGRIMILGSDSAITVRHKIGYLPEERGLYRKMKAVDTIAYFARLRGVKPRLARKRAKELLKEFGLEAFAKSKNEALSKGMAQKVQLLATLAHEPELLILDEPFSGLDPINQHTLEILIKRLRDQGRTIIFSTHVMSHAERLCDRFLILAKGQKRFEGTLQEARDLFPPRLFIRTADNIDILRTISGVIRVTKMAGDNDIMGAVIAGTHPTGEQIEHDYELEFQKDFDIQLILKAAFEAGIRLTRFEHASTSLHDIFMAIAGEETRTIQEDGNALLSGSRYSFDATRQQMTYHESGPEDTAPENPVHVNNEVSS